MAKIKKGPLAAITGTLIVIILALAIFHGGGAPASGKIKESMNPYITTAPIVKIPVAPILGTQVETGYKLIITDGFTSTATVFTLTNVYAPTSVSGAEQIIVNTVTTKIGENANYDSNSSVWTVYRTTMGMSENKVISFTTNNYEPYFDVLKYYYLSPHYITFQIGSYTTPIVYIYESSYGVLTIYLEPSAITYDNQITYTTTENGKVYTIVSVMRGTYFLTSAKYDTEILGS